MVFGPMNLARFRQQGIEVAAPARRVFALAIAVHLGGVEHRLDPAAQPIRSFSPGRPNWGKHLHHHRGVDASDRHVAQDRIGVGGYRVVPLLTMASVPPTGLLALHQLFSNLAERSPGLALRLFLSKPRSERVDSLSALFPICFRPLARPCETDGRECAQAHVPTLAVELVSKHPTL